MPDSIISLEDYKTENEPHITKEVICLNCKHRYIAVYPADIWMVKLECPKCKKRGFIIGTGQDLDITEEEYDPLKTA